MIPPIILQHEGGGRFKTVTPYMTRLADEHYEAKETYRMVEHQERSMRTHNHYFAAVSDLWQTLPEQLMSEYPSAEHLRKKALIRCGYADEQSHVCPSKAEALRVAAFIRPLDDYSIVDIRGPVVTRYTAKSQSMKAMGAKVFKESKDRVLDWIEALVSGEAPKRTEAA